MNKKNNCKENAEDIKDICELTSSDIKDDKALLTNIANERINVIFDVSSEKNRNMLFVFVVFQLYLLVTIGGTTDVHLLLPNINFQLPIINVSVPISGFYVIAPLLLLAFHSLVLLNLEQHVSILKKWRMLSKDLDLKFPFLINSLGEGRTGIDTILIHSVCKLLVITLPFLLLVFFQLRYSDFHSFGMSFYHLCLVVIDFIILIIYLSKMDFVFNRAFKQISLWILFSISFLNIIILHFVINDTLEVKQWIERKTHPKRNIQEPLTFLSKAQFSWVLSWGLPIIDVTGQEIVSIKQAYHGIDGLEKYENRIPLYKKEDLSDRHLELGEFKSANLVLVDLSGAYLDGANFSEADLHGANLSETNIKGSSFLKARLQNTNFNKAKLQQVSFTLADLNGANFDHAEMKNVSFLRADMANTSLWNATLQGVDLSYSKLQGASFKAAKVLASDFSNAHLEGINFSYAQLHATDLSETNLEGVSFYEAELIGANLKETKVFGCIMDRAILFAIQNASNLNGCMGNIQLQGYSPFRASENKVDWTSDEHWEKLHLMLTAKGLEKSEIKAASFRSIFFTPSKLIKNAYASAKLFDDSYFDERHIPVTGHRYSNKNDEAIRHLQRNRRAMACRSQQMAKMIHDGNELLKISRVLYDSELVNHLKNNVTCNKNNIEWK